MNNTIKFAFVRDSAFNVAPNRKNSTDAGIDLYADGDYIIKNGGVEIVKTNLLVEIPKGYFGWITNKSKNDYLIGGGIVDQDYQGELLIKVINVSGKDLHLSWEGKAVAQLLIIPCITPIVEIVDKNNIHVVQTARGASGGILSQLSYETGDGTMFEELAERMDDFDMVVGGKDSYGSLD